MSKYPEWVTQFRRPGTSIKKNGNNYYLFRTTSKRVPGKRNPQPVSEYIGVITPEGVKETQNKRLNVENIAVHEYGFTRAVVDLAPESWKKTFESDDVARNTLLRIIAEASPRSYLKEEIREDMMMNDGYEISLPTRRSNLESAMGFTISSLEDLKHIYILDFGDRQVVSRIEDDSMKVIRALGLEM